MIRFSAGLVAVAIGVLIGGIATSRLLLVYMAIVLSAVALVALAIGVALKREELFGEERGTAPAQAGASPVLSAGASDREDQGRSNGHVPPPQGAAVGPGAAFAGTAQATSPQPRGTWENRTGDDSWPSPATASSFPAARQTAAPFGAPAAGWGAPAAGEAPAPRAPAVQGGGTEPRSPGASAPSVFAPRTASASAAAPGVEPAADRLDWFSPSGKAASADRPAPGTGAAWSWMNAGTSADTVPGDKKAGKQRQPADAPALEDDDWPARYSWLDDKPAGSDDASDDKPVGTVRADQEGTAPESGSPVVAVAAGPQDVVVPDASATPETPHAGTLAPETREATAPRSDDEVDAERDAGSHLAAPAEADGSATPRLARDRAPEAPAPEVPAPEAPAPAPAPEAPAPEAGEPAVPGEPESEPSAATAAADDAGLVTVVRGVPRFHQRDCVLIRFMSDDDIQKLPLAQAKEAGCTPCAACQPD